MFLFTFKREKKIREPVVIAIFSVRVALLLCSEV